MSADVQMLEKPIKYALIAMAVFVVSAFILGNLFEVLALASLSMPLSSKWDDVQAIAGLSMDRTLRYTMFYFLIFLAFSCYERSALKSSPWGMLILFGMLPVVMAFVPFIYSDEFRVSSHWASTAILFSMLYLGVGHKYPSKLLRGFFLLLMAYVVLMSIVQDVFAWGEAINAETKKMYGAGDTANNRVYQTFVWFAPVELARVGVNLYLLYWLPQKFFLEQKGNDSQANP
ncbi:MAG: hypothetical protein C0406_04695 [Sideroxydans sp.]|nr:hypothetical protein [Sideroxydans sp.]